jgi:hypothetical protein
MFAAQSEAGLIGTWLFDEGKGNEAVLEVTEN